jgi:hypothetical protein
MKIGTIVFIAIALAFTGCGVLSSSTESGQKISKQDKKADHISSWSGQPRPLVEKPSR